MHFGLFSSIENSSLKLTDLFSIKRIFRGETETYSRVERLFELDNNPPQADIELYSRRVTCLV